jgi:uncharacterized membrane protein
MTSKRRNQDGPKSELARYAFGYSDKKPSVTFWVIQAAMVVIALGGIFAVEFR